MKMTAESKSFRVPDFTLETFFFDLWFDGGIMIICCLIFLCYRKKRKDNALFEKKINSKLDEVNKGLNLLPTDLHFDTKHKKREDMKV
jgi:hypothetical protein